MRKDKIKSEMKTDKMKTDSNERDGKTECNKTPKTWAGKVCACIDSLDTCGTVKRKQWFTHKAIIKAMSNAGYGLPRNIGQTLFALVKTGHLERAHKPVKLRKNANYKEFIYRRTGKPYKAFQYMNDGKIEKGLDVYFENRKHEKWFREMMVYE